MGGVWQRWEALVSRLLGPVSRMQALEPGIPGSTPSRYSSLQCAPGQL